MMRRWRKSLNGRRLALVLVLLAALAAALLVGVAVQDDPPQRKQAASPTRQPTIDFHTSKATGAADLEDIRKVVGRADIVIVGRVAEVVSNEPLADDYPATQYRIDVLDTLKGDPEPTVIVEHGVGPNGEGRIVSKSGQSPLIVGDEYILVAVVDANRNRFALIERTAFSEVRIVDATQRDQLIAKYSAAVENEITPEFLDGIFGEIERLIEDIDSAAAPEGIRNSLIAKLERVHEAMNTADSGDLRELARKGCPPLDAFLAELNGSGESHFTPADLQEFRARANTVRSRLGCR